MNSQVTFHSSNRVKSKHVFKVNLWTVLPSKSDEVQVLPTVRHIRIEFICNGSESTRKTMINYSILAE